MNFAFQEATEPGGLPDAAIKEMLAARLAAEAPPKRVLILPPDISRLNSYAGPITKMIFDLLPDAAIDVMPALGTHIAMTGEEMDRMYPEVPHAAFIEHRWREDVTYLGDVPGSFVREVSGGLLDTPIRVEINRRLVDGSYDCIVSVG
ncbi:MAG: D-mannonate epimerase, partial [Planctomycetes bacterium]|nr:D-mannonate epimerase [Planctomycetota bacterium]